SVVAADPGRDRRWGEILTIFQEDIFEPPPKRYDRSGGSENGAGRSATAAVNFRAEGTRPAKKPFSYRRFPPPPHPAQGLALPRSRAKSRASARSDGNAPGQNLCHRLGA